MIVAANPIDQDALRLRHEFLQMPGLDVSVPQVARMLGLRPEHAAAILDALASERFLTQTPTGSYQRAFASHLIEH
jgi:DNA-binding IclR family transcriptional regulator